VGNAFSARKGESTVVYFKVGKGPGREITQCEPKPDRVRKIVAKPAPEPVSEPVEDLDLRPDFEKFLKLLHKKTVPWVKGEIKKIQTVDEVDQALEKEYAHPRFEGGRSGIIDDLQERRDELTEPNTGPPKDTEAMKPTNTVAAGLPCPDCAFSAGSQEGLDAHMEAHHSAAEEDL